DRLLELGFEGFTNGKDLPGLCFVSLGEDNAIEGALRWQQFLEDDIPQLESEGWQIEIDDSFQLQFHQISDEWNVEIEDHNEWFDLSFDIEINGKKRALLPLITSILQNYDSNQLPEQLIIQSGPSEYINLPSESLKPVIDTLYELFDDESLSSDGKLRLSLFDAGRLDQLEQNTNAQWLGGKALRKLGSKLNSFKGIQEIKPPKALNAELREYQQQGLNWLQFLREYQFNGILADDMGLGKTVQTLAHLQYEKQCRRLKQPCLIIAPTSLVSNWRRESEKFTPRLKILVLHGPDRRELFDQIEHHDLVITTYPLLVRDAEILQQHHYHYLVLDEAQVIKNPKAKAAQLVRELNSNHRLCLTGTPMENHLGELWALFDFLMPGFLGDTRQFKQLFRTPIEQHGDTETQQRLSQRVAPFMLRRTKSVVAHELPEKTEIIRSVPLDTKQAALYESIRISMDKKVRDAIKQKGLARSHITILDALLKLRQCCCDPGLLKLKQAQSVDQSAKLETLMEMVPEMLEEGRRILLFSQFTQMISIIEKRLQALDINYAKLTGQTRKRDDAIQSFKDGDADIFLISLKAGGVGLNLTEADTVIHYDPWWNPAAESQATDRAHRIGQNKAVFVYKLITENTLEEKILAMQDKKQALADSVYNKEQSERSDSTFSGEELASLFAPL
ncbi:DEAD/DEAH box helicase, partial [Pseudomonadota bacterium]